MFILSEKVTKFPVLESSETTNRSHSSHLFLYVSYLPFLLFIPTCSSSNGSSLHMPALFTLIKICGSHILSAVIRIF